MDEELQQLLKRELQIIASIGREKTNQEWAESMKELYDIMTRKLSLLRSDTIESLEIKLEKLTDTVQLLQIRLAKQNEINRRLTESNNTLIWQLAEQDKFIQELTNNDEQETKDADNKQGDEQENKGVEILKFSHHGTKIKLNETKKCAVYNGFGYNGYVIPDCHPVKSGVHVFRINVSFYCLLCI